MKRGKCFSSRRLNRSGRSFRQSISSSTSTRPSSSSCWACLRLAILTSSRGEWEAVAKDSINFEKYYSTLSASIRDCVTKSWRGLVKPTARNSQARSIANILNNMVIVFLYSVIQFFATSGMCPPLTQYRSFQGHSRMNCALWSPFPETCRTLDKDILQHQAFDLRHGKHMGDILIRNDACNPLSWATDWQKVDTYYWAMPERMQRICPNFNEYNEIISSSAI